MAESTPSCPTIECGKCGTEHHYDARNTTCRDCSAFLRDSTDAEDAQFSAFLEHNSDFVETD